MVQLSYPSQQQLCIRHRANHAQDLWRYQNPKGRSRLWDYRIMCSRRWIIGHTYRHGRPWDRLYGCKSFTVRYRVAINLEPAWSIQILDAPSHSRKMCSLQLVETPFRHKHRKRASLYNVHRFFYWALQFLTNILNQLIHYRSYNKMNSTLSFYSTEEYPELTLLEKNWSVID